MIAKIAPRLTSIAKQPVRANLQKTTVAGLAVLAGSSMSGANTPYFEPTDMIIPGGLNLREKAYYIITKEMPKSVVNRWFPQTDDYIVGQNDQIVTANIGDGRYVGSIITGPRNALGGEPLEALDVNSSNKIIGNPDSDILADGGVTSDSDDIGSTDTSDGGSGLSALEIFKHLAGYHD